MMLSTGNLRKLQTELRLIKFRDVDHKLLSIGNPCELLKIYHYLVLDFNPLFAKTLLDQCKCDFYGKTDNHFIDTMYKILRDYFNYKPPITKEQFFSNNFAEKKLQMAYEIILLVREECKQINTKQNQAKRSETCKKQISTNVYHPLHDMGLEPTIANEIDSMEPENQEKLKTTVNDLEEQIEFLKIKIEDINERLINITSVLQDTHLKSSDLINFNARLIMVENELSLLKTQPFPDNQTICEPKPKRSIIAQGILI